MIFYLIHPDYQNKAVTAIIFSMNTILLSKKRVNCFRTPELADNTAVHNLWKLSSRVHCRRKLLERTLKKVFRFFRNQF
jgi:hypothetical protein